MINKIRVLYHFFLKFLFFIKYDNFFFLNNINKIYRGISNNICNHKTYELKKNYKYKFSYRDFFSYNIPNWLSVIPKLKPINYLEIGCFEGRTLSFLCQLNNLRSVVLVDNLKGGFGCSIKNINFNLVKKNLFFNLNLLNIKKEVFLNNSDTFFKRNKKKYNLIYIDGSHHYKDVIKDISYAYFVLERGGILICDDFCKDYKNKKISATKAILDYLKKNNKKFKILEINYQIYLKKI